MRVAATRLGAVNAAIEVQQSTRSHISLLRDGRVALGLAGTAVSGLLLSRMALRALHPKAVAAAAVKAPNPWGALAVQGLSMLVFPLLQQYVTGKRELPKMPELRMPQLPSLDFSTLFYRWLGLIK